MDELHNLERCCRLCAEEQEATILLFSAEAKAMLLQNKLNKYLLIEVEEDDKLPKNICIRCCSKLQMVCDFIDTARKAQEVLSEKISAIEANELGLQRIKSELESWSDNETKDDTIEVNVDPMDVLQNSQGLISPPETSEVYNTNDPEDVTYLHAVDGQNVTIKLIKRSTEEQTELDFDLKGEVLKPFPCMICNKSYCSEIALKNHIWTHNNETVMEYTCNACGIQCESKADFLIHLKRHKQSGMCQICGRVFRTEANLALHMANHMCAGKSFTCKICGRSYSTHSNLKNHSIAHSSERPYKCHVCKKGFKRNQDLKFHLNQHTGAKPYKCPFCDKRFASSGNCYSHRTRMHPGWKAEAKLRRRVSQENQLVRTIVTRPNCTARNVMKYQCTLCSHAFLKRDNYMYHMYQHTGKKPFQCTFCSEEFVTRKGLYLHHEKEHPKKDRPLGLVSKNALLK